MEANQSKENKLVTLNKRNPHSLFSFHFSLVLFHRSYYSEIIYVVKCFQELVLNAEEANENDVPYTEYRSVHMIN